MALNYPLTMNRNDWKKTIDDLLVNGRCGDEINIERRDSFLVYQKTPQNHVEIVRQIIKNGYYLYYVTGSLGNDLIMTGRYFISKSKYAAKRSYETLYGWKPSRVRLVTDMNEINSVLSDKNKMPL